MTLVPASITLCAAALLAAAGAAAQTPYPVRPIRIIVPQAPASGPDIMARTIAQKLTESWGQPVLVDNRPGANGIIGMEAVAKSKPDGYTLVMSVPSALTMNPYVYKQLPYDTFRDFTPITQTATNTFGLVVNPVLPAKTVKELVALGKARPGQLNYSSFGIGNQTHLAAELFSGVTGLKTVHVPYKGQTPAVTELVAGQVSFMFTPMPGAAGMVDAGKLRLLATCGEQRDATYKAAPTMREAGYPEVIITGWSGLLGPAGMPADVANRLQAEIARHLLTPEMRESIRKQGAEAVVSTPEQFAAFIKAEARKWSQVIKRAGLEFTQ
jgi:tripartite-type tricarboxylate transporter receptor subunit TctC